MPEIVIGIVVALLVYEYMGHAPGGVITAGCMALYWPRWEFILATVLAAVVVRGLGRLLMGCMVLYGRRLFCVHLLLGLLLGQGVASFLGTGVFGVEFASIGYLLPGLIAWDMERQGHMPTLGALLLAVSITRIAVFAGEGWLW